MSRYSVMLFAALAFAAGTANAQQPLGNLGNTLNTVLANTTGGSLPGNPGNLGGDLDNLNTFILDVQEPLTNGDLNSVLTETIANTTSGQLPGDLGNIGGDIENLGNFGQDLINALATGQQLPGL